MVGNYAYLLGYKLWIVDISGVPFTDPFGAGYREIEVSDVRDVAITGNYAFLAAGGNGLGIVDISNPAIRSEVDFWDTDIFGYADSVTVAGQYAFITDEQGLRVFDVIDPTQPEQVGSYDTPGDANEVIVSDGYIYLADGEGGLLI